MEHSSEVNFAVHFTLSNDSKINKFVKEKIPQTRMQNTTPKYLSMFCARMFLYKLILVNLC